MLHCSFFKWLQWLLYYRRLRGLSNALPFDRVDCTIFRTPWRQPWTFTAHIPVPSDNSPFTSHVVLWWLPISVPGSVIMSLPVFPVARSKSPLHRPQSVSLRHVRVGGGKFITFSLVCGRSFTFTLHFINYQGRRTHSISHSHDDADGERLRLKVGGLFHPGRIPSGADSDD